ncbi:helix-turn-helix transcriptional regulator [uncultured Clostridium sp.]|uniref:helix-turn-helix domain-containing protein n=1 Tax=uncultured Clostridium sp. TaxID=59620 RepID=UPI002621864E|nr:helix-turn-helix transcriptional regulator [uncultured Clostridium sp.]
MRVNEIIKYYRKKEGLTQEDIANYLNISSTAISKWETGASYPDITLLSKLARILKIDVNTLIGFGDKLSDQEINKKLKRIKEINKEEGFEKAFAEGVGFIKEYPNSDKLIFNLMTYLYIWLKKSKIDSKEIYEEKIINFYKLIENSTEENISLRVKHTLIYLYRSKRKYKKAEEILEKIPNDNGINKKLQQILIDKESGNMKKAYKNCEEILFKNNIENLIIMEQIIKMLCIEKKFDEAIDYLEYTKKFIKGSELGVNKKNEMNLVLGIGLQDKERTIDAIKDILNQKILDYSKTKLYKNLEFTNTEMKGNYVELLKEMVLNNKELDFVREEPKFKFLIEDF